MDVGNVIKKIATNTGILLATATAAIATVSWTSSKRRDKERESQDDLRSQQIASMRTDIAVMKQCSPTTMMGLEPCPGDRAARVLAARNGAGMGIDTSNPEVSLPYDVVR